MEMKDETTFTHTKRPIVTSFDESRQFVLLTNEVKHCTSYEWLLHGPVFQNLFLATFVGIIFTPWCRVLLEKLTDLQLVKKFSAFYGTRRFITALTSVRHLSLSWANPIQSIYPHPTS